MSLFVSIKMFAHGWVTLNIAYSPVHIVEQKREISGGMWQSVVYYLLGELGRGGLS